MRGLRRSALAKLDLRSEGMEFASEMVIRASKAQLKVSEFPISLHPRGGRSKLNPFSDGWRHLRLMLMHNPTFLFVAPGFLTALIGALIMLAAFVHASLLGHAFYIHTMIAGSLLVVVGTQLLGFGLCGRIYAVHQLGDRDPWLERRIAQLRLEHGLLLGAALTVAGVAVGAFVVAKWFAHGLGNLGEERATVLAATLVIVGVQVFFTSFMLSILSMRRRDQ
jgi:hypothetical protein